MHTRHWIMLIETENTNNEETYFLLISRNYIFVENYHLRCTRYIYLDVYHVANHGLNRLFSNIDLFFKNSLNDICRIKKKMIHLAWLKYPSNSNNLTLPRTGTVRKWVWNGLKYYQRQWGSSSQKTLPLHYLFLSSLSLSLISFFCEV